MPTPNARSEHQGPAIEAAYIILRTTAAYSWQLFSADRELLAVSATTYPSLQGCHAAIERTRKTCSAKIRMDPAAEV
jgi:hypothetical protein